MLILKKIKNFFNPILSFKLSDAQSWLDKLRSKINEIKIKSRNLTKTNYNLGLYHFNAGNLNDAIFRFKLSSLFQSFMIILFCLIVECIMVLHF